MWGVNRHVGVQKETEIDHSPHIMCCKPPLNGELSSSEHIIQPSKSEVSNNVSEDETTAKPDEITSEVTGAKEKDILDKLHPVWFGRKHGYHGKTYPHFTQEQLCLEGVML